MSAGDAGEFLLRQAGLEPGRRHERDRPDGGLLASQVALPLRIGEGVLELGDRRVQFFRRRSTWLRGWRR